MNTVVLLGAPSQGLEACFEIRASVDKTLAHGTGDSALFLGRLLQLQHTWSSEQPQDCSDALRQDAS